jgi:stage II sporulation protein D
MLVLFESPTAFPQLSNPESETVTVAGRRYRGRIELGRYRGANIVGVNVLNVEHYLYGVVPGERPSSFHTEALKAQSVAARNYAMSNTNRHAADGYGVCDTVHCQVFLGAAGEHPTTSAAVDATRGVLAYHNGSLISCTYFSSSGGYTENSENVWFEALPYARAVPDLHEMNDSSWTRTFTYAELTAICITRGVNIGTVTKVEATGVLPGGRVHELTFTGTNGTHKITKDEVRTFFAVSGQTMLRSRMFTVGGNGQPVTTENDIYVLGKNGTERIKASQSFAVNDAGVIAKTSPTDGLLNILGVNGLSVFHVNTAVQNSQPTGDTVTFTGKGNGHGVGMSQHGANGMGHAGFTYVQILKHYYTGIDVY